ncbi:MAG: septum formation family protein [Acidimicrobiales bacterium]
MAALVVSLASVVGLFLLIVPPLVAVVLGAIALRRINRDPARSGKGLAVAGLTIGIVLVLAGGALDAGIAVAAKNRVRYSNVVAGICIKDPGGPVTDVVKQSCDSAHEREVFATFDDPAISSAPYPTANEIRDLGTSECTSRFAAYVGTPLASSSLRVQYLYPRQQSWDSGNRRFICMAATRDGSPLTGSVRDSHR